MSEFDKKNQNPLEEESVDDILAGIINPDGSFNEEWGGMLARYSGIEETVITVPKVDISDRRTDVVPGTRVEFEAAAESHIPFSGRDTADKRINDKIPPEMREIYDEVTAEVSRPEFTASGTVRYPSMGMGESEQRVIYDADWEESAKAEAARRERVRQDRMLRGDSTYVRNMIPGGMYVSSRPSYTEAPATNSIYIDPLSRDADFESAKIDSLYYSSTKKSFFPEGFSVVQKNNAASGGKTEKYRGGSDSFRRANAEWLQIEEKPKKKKRGFGKKQKDEFERRKYPTLEEAVNTRLQEQQPEVQENVAENPKRTETAVDTSELLQVTQQTEGLRSTVAEIVDKYNKRSEEDARRLLEEKTREEDLRREQELRERMRLEEIRKMKPQMSQGLCDVIDSAADDSEFEEYDDFSTEPREKKEPKEKESFGVFFDASALENDSVVEKISVQLQSNEKTAVKTKDTNSASREAEGVYFNSSAFDGGDYLEKFSFDEQALNEETEKQTPEAREPKSSSGKKKKRFK